MRLDQSQREHSGARTLCDIVRCDPLISSFAARLSRCGQLAYQVNRGNQLLMNLPLPAHERLAWIASTALRAAILLWMALAVSAVFVMSLGTDEAWVLNGLRSAIHPQLPYLSTELIVTSGGLFALVNTLLEWAGGKSGLVAPPALFGLPRLGFCHGAWGASSQHGPGSRQMVDGGTVDRPTRRGRSRDLGAWHLNRTLLANGCGARLDFGALVLANACALHRGALWTRRGVSFRTRAVWPGAAVLQLRQACASASASAHLFDTRNTGCDAGVCDFPHESVPDVASCKRGRCRGCWRIDWFDKLWLQLPQDPESLGNSGFVCSSVLPCSRGGGLLLDRRIRAKGHSVGRTVHIRVPHFYDRACASRRLDV